METDEVVGGVVTEELTEEKMVMPTEFEIEDGADEEVGEDVDDGADEEVGEIVEEAADEEVGEDVEEAAEEEAGERAEDVAKVADDTGG